MRTINFIFLMGIILTSSCGGSSSSSTDTTEIASESENTVVAVSSIFSGAGGADTQSLVGRFAINTTGENICLTENMQNTPTGLWMSERGGVSDRPFGSASDPMTISSVADYCQDDSNNDNTGTGPDGQGLFATFVFLGDPEGTCDDDSSFTFTGGSGIARNTDTYFPEIYGRFAISGVGNLNCTIRILQDGTVDFDNSSCTDDDDHELALDQGSTCSIDANLPPIADPEYYKGHYGMGESLERNLNYDCVTYDGFTMDETTHIMSVNYDCSALIALGTNIEFLSIGAYATDTSAAQDSSSWEMDYSGTSHAELRPQVQLLHAAGFQVALSFDILYYEDPANPDDDVDFPAALINNTTFRDELAVFIEGEAQFAQDVGADIFVPLSESDRVFALASSDDDEFLAGIMDRIQNEYTGKLAYVWSYDLSEYNAENLVDFDLIGFNRSPSGHDHLDENCSGVGSDSNCFVETLEADLVQQQTVIEEIRSNGGDPIAFIDSLGVWGNAVETEFNPNIVGEVDWMEDSTNAAMFEMAFGLADEYDLGGFVAWEGANDEFVFPSSPLTLEVITQGFLGR